MALSLLRWLVGRIGRWSARRADFFGRLLGRIAWLVGVRRRVVLDNLRQALGVDLPMARRIGRRAMEQFGQVILELPRAATLSGADARRLIGERNLLRLSRVLAPGRGLIILSAHLGSWDLLACAAARAGFDVCVVTRSLKQGALSEVWMEQRRACGVELIAARGGGRSIVRALRRGAIVAMVLDQHQPGGLVVPFFGRPAATSDAVARLARLSGAPVMPAFLMRAAGAHHLRLGAPIPLVSAAGAGEQLRRTTATYTAVIERAIRRDPTQWFWLHRRWKVRSVICPADSASAVGRCAES